MAEAELSEEFGELPIEGAAEGTGGTLTAEQQERLDATKIQINMENERYLQAHPEIRDMISVFVHQVLEYKPDNVLRFAGDFFTRPDLYACVKKKTEEVRKG
eukprot:TRINITY_DN124840_c0_g1_i1.p1 TRINITY_DN124840_c0_g1~~TRINITY_DN124840_c0_g1_i1.p1  ORF type:complete len:102 (+),score=38.65 TRINITY_DN124840_c0_g1_i1:88-393(+)